MAKHQQMGISLHGSFTNDFLAGGAGDVELNSFKVKYISKDSHDTLYLESIVKMIWVQ